MGASQLKAVVHLNHVTPPRCRGITGRNLHNKHSVLTEGLIQVRGSREKHRRVPPLPALLQVYTCTFFKRSISSSAVSV